MLDPAHITPVELRRLHRNLLNPVHLVTNKKSLLHVSSKDLTRPNASLFSTSPPLEKISSWTKYRTSDSSDLVQTFQRASKNPCTTSRSVIDSPSLGISSRKSGLNHTTGTSTSIIHLIVKKKTISTLIVLDRSLSQAKGFTDFPEIQLIRCRATK